MLDPDFARHVQILFSSVAGRARNSFPQILSLSEGLERRFLNAERASADNPTFRLGIDDQALFATASVEMWQRGVHSYLISASLTEVSPIWSSVSGYYSSHYSVRALAHLQGCFNLRKRRKMVHLRTHNDSQVASYEKRTWSDREHSVYWRIVKENPSFRDDPLFTENKNDTEASDVAHRDRSNYADLVNIFPKFEPLSIEQLKKRITQISQMTFDVPPIPRLDRPFPDLTSVQVVAYQRMIRYRHVLDEALGTTNRFWSANRDPNWANMLKFQLAPQGGRAAAYGDRK